MTEGDESMCPIPGCHWRYLSPAPDLPPDCPLDEFRAVFMAQYKEAYHAVNEHILDHMMYGNAIPAVKPAPRPFDGLEAVLPFLRPDPG